MKIAMLLPPGRRGSIFTQARIDQLHEWGEVSFNDATNSPEDIRAALKDADIAITSWGTPSFDKEILDAAPNLKAVIHAAGTVKPIVTDELWARGIRVSSANGPLGIGVAETALGLTIASLKNMWKMARDTRQGGWSEEKQYVRELFEVTIGVIGGGKAGRHYIKLLQNFDVDVLLADPLVTAEQAKEMGATKVELEELMSRSDVISIHAPSLPSTYKMINKERIALMKDRAILINTARGSIIDEDALAAELATERIFACIDVTDPEPPVADHPFRSLKNCTLTSHIAGAVTNGLHRIGKHAMREIELFLAGERMAAEVTEQEMATLA